MSPHTETLRLSVNEADSGDLELKDAEAEAGAAAAAAGLGAASVWPITAIAEPLRVTCQKEATQQDVNAWPWKTRVSTAWTSSPSFSCCFCNGLHHALSPITTHWHV